MVSQKGVKKQGDMVAVAVDKDKGSQAALKWAVDSLLTKGKTVTLLHVRKKASSPASGKAPIDAHAKEFFLPFRCFCSRKDIQVNEIVLEDSDIARAICEYVRNNMIESLVVGSSVKNGFMRTFKFVDIPSTISKAAPEFCTVYVISKGKIASVKSASSLPPPPVSLQDEPDSTRSSFIRGKCLNREREPTTPESGSVSFVSSGRTSSEHIFQSHDRLSSSSETENRLSFGSSRISDGSGSFGMFSSSSVESGNFSSSGSHNMDEVEAEMRRLKQELKQTMQMYSTACKEALSAKQKAIELHHWKLEEEKRLVEARLAEEAALEIAKREKAKCKAAIDRAEAAQRIAELEAQKRISAERKANERNNRMDNFSNISIRYRRYTIEEIESATEYFSTSLKIGEGGYGPVFKCYLDHTPAAVKVLRPDAAQGRSQFQQEVEVLSCIRHPNMVLLLGACPEYGCLVYEYMANGSLDDCLFQRGNTLVLSWQIRFKIASEIATGLLFLHQTKPEPLVHRDLKPGNILLDGNFVSKISDVGLARLVPPSVADNVTQYRMTATAGTFCYIDPEYQQTGMLGVKSDVYSLGIMLLQIITAKPPMGLTHHVQRSIDLGTFSEMLDPAVQDWPLEEALSFAKMAIRCAELRRRDRPDLANIVLPELNRLRAFAEKTMPCVTVTSVHESYYSQVMHKGNAQESWKLSSGPQSTRSQSLSEYGAE